MMKKIYSAVFIGVFALACFSPVCNFALGKAMPSVFGSPSQLSSSSSSTALSLSQIKKDPLGSLLSGALVSTVESKLSDKLGAWVPGHDALLLGNASLQRLGVETANTVAGYGVYPTYYGSDHFVEPSTGRIGYINKQMADVDPECYEAWVDGINAVAGNNLGVRFAYCQTYTSRESWYSAAYGMTSDPLTHEYVVENVLDRLSDSVAAVDDPFTSEDDYLSGWFSTDHHWTAQRALRAYGLLAGKLGWAELPAQGTLGVGSTWHGSFCRVGLDMDYGSAMLDNDATWPDLRWEGFLYKSKEGERYAYLGGAVSYPNGVYNLYDKYYGSTNCEAWNDAEGAEGTCLVICNSMGRALKEPIASNYRHTVFRDPLNNVQDMTLQELIDAYDPDDVVFISTPGYESMKTKNPNFFEL